MHRFTRLVLFTPQDRLQSNTDRQWKLPVEAEARVSFYMAGSPHLDIPSLQGFREMLLLQHYGCPTPYLDITHQTHIALWFALHKLTSVSEGKIKAERIRSIEGSPEEWPTIYIFLLDPSLHPVIDTSTILADSPFSRPKLQKCGLLGGAGSLARNYAARYIAIKLRLGHGFLAMELPETHKLFPKPSEDKGLEELLRLEGRYDNDKLFRVYDVIE